MWQRERNRERKRKRESLCACSTCVCMCVHAHAMHTLCRTTRVHIQTHRIHAHRGTMCWNWKCFRCWPAPLLSALKGLSCIMICRLMCLHAISTGEKSASIDVSTFQEQRRQQFFVFFSSRIFMPATSICYLDECIHRSDAPFGNVVITEFEAWGHPLRVGQVSAHLQEAAAAAEAADGNLDFAHFLATSCRRRESPQSFCRK